MSAPLVELNNGQKMPQIGLGTWLAAPGEIGPVVKTAIELGYRHFDCAMLYGNEKEIGEGLREGMRTANVPREELFITTKLWNMFHERQEVVPTCKTSLENLGLDYLDLYLIHWPVAQKFDKQLDFRFPFMNAEAYDYDYVHTWKGMEECVRLGLTKTIGLSNFNAEQIGRVLDSCSIKPVTNQIEVNLFNNEKKMIQFCKERNLLVTAYSPLSSPTRPWAQPNEPKLDFQDPQLLAIAQKHRKSVGQILLRHLVQNGTVPIPKTVNVQRLKENLNIFDFQLSQDDMAIIDGYNQDFRAIAAVEFKDMPNYPFKNWI